MKGSIATSLGGVSLAVLASAAQARTPPLGQNATSIPAATSNDLTQASDIIVTGSRVAQNGNQTPTPVTTIATDKLQEIRPSTIADGLNMLPVFSGSRTPTNGASAVGGVGGGNAVSNQLNLRNVGPTRNLILMDGHRVAPTTNTNAVDVDMIPQMLLSRVDVVTGGVSAVYGSDAISGVVNFVINRDLDRLRVQASSGISRYGDDPNSDIGLAAGTKIGSRGHFEASYEFRDNAGILKRSDRPWYQQAVVVGPATATQANPGTYQTVTDARNPAQPFGGRITCTGACSTSAINGQYFATDGVLSNFVNGTPTLSNLQIGGAGGYHDASLVSPLRSHQFFGRFDYDLTDSIHFYAYGSGNIKRNLGYTTDMVINSTLSVNNPFLAQAYRAALAATGATTFNFQRTLDSAPLGFESKSNQYIGVAGFEGKLGSNWKWNAAYNYGYSLLRTTILNNVNNQNLAAALDTTTVNGQIVCRSIATNPGCVPLNPFGPSATTSQMLGYVLGNTGYRAVTKLNDGTADIGGSPFSTWAGPVQIDLSGEWRRLTFSSTSQATPSQFANCTGITANCSGSTLLWQQTFAPRSTVGQGVREAALEVEVPLLKDAPLAKSFIVNGAGRFTDYYDSVGRYWTWKVGAVWEVNDMIRFRGTVSRDIRAPTLNDLYSPPAVVVSNSGFDVRTNSSPTVPQVTTGNPDLTAEVGHTKTVGVVIKPARSLSLAIDYFNITVANAILLTPGFTVSYQNSCIADASSPYCLLQHRDANGVVTQWDVKPLNIGELKTYGVDGELNYSTRVFDRAFSLRGFVSWQPHIRYIQPGVPTVDQGGVAFGSVGVTASPKWRVTAMGSYNISDAFRIDVQERWRSNLKQWGDPTIVFSSGGTIPSYALTTLNLSYTITNTRFGKYEIFGNINNLFDVNPQPGGPPASGTSTPGAGNGFSTYDDVIGRYFTVGVRLAL